MTTVGDSAVTGPAPRPCSSCPYRCDAPSGLWAAVEYEKLVAYDRDTANQPTNLFLCHQTNAGDEGARLCAGWVGCHGENLLALRLAAARGELAAADLRSVFEYCSPVALFRSGADAAAHGMTNIDNPDPAACEMIEKIRARRTDLR